MTTPTPSDRELLSAYLSGDLEAEAARELEARLAEEPALAAELDGMAQMLVGLQGVSEVEPPPGYEERLRARLTDENASATTSEDSPSTPVTDLGTVRRRRWPAVASAAAALLLVALVGAGVLGELPFGSQAQDAAAPDSDGAERATEQSTEEGAEDGPTEDQSFDRAPAAPEPEAAPAPGEPDSREGHRPGGPVVLDNEVALSDEAAVRRRHDELPEVQRLLGQSVPEAHDTAARFRAFLADAPPFRSGIRPDACLDEAADAPEGEGPRVPARVETVVYAGSPALAYVLVEPSAGSTQLDRAVTRLLRPRSCETRAVVVVEEGAS